MIKLRLSLIIAIVILSLIRISNAQTKDTMQVNMSEITVTSSVRATENTPVTFTDISLKSIESKSFGQEMPQFLSKSPSITFYSDAGSMNGYSYMRMRGIDNVRINFILNGVPLNEPEDQGAYFNNYVDFLSNIESIQIQRGVGTSTNGVASYGGSVNFQSKFFTTPKTETDFMIGSFGTKKFSFGTQTKLSNNFYFYGRFSDFTTLGYRNNSSNASLSGFASLMYVDNTNVFQYLTFYGSQQNQMAYLATSVTDLTINPKMNYLSPDEKDNFDYYFNQFQYSKSFSNEFTLNSSIYYIRQLGNYGVKMNDMYNFRLNFDFYGAMLNLNYKNNDLQFDWGIHVNTYTRHHSMGMIDVTTPDLYNNSGNKNEMSSFVKIGYLFDPILFYVDMQYRHIEFKYNTDASYNLLFTPIYWNFFNPKAGFSVKSGEITYYTSIGLMHREPTRNDMFNGDDNIDYNNYTELKDFSRVKPEQVIDAELGMKYEDKFVNIDFDIFNMDFENEIAQIGQLSYIVLPLKKNVPSSNRMGIEFDGTAKINKRISISENFTIMRGNINTYTRDYDNMIFHNVEPLLTPNVLSNTSVSYDMGIKLTVDGRYIGSSYLDNENTQKVPSAFVMDFRTEVNFNTFSVIFNWNNVLNKTYYSSGYVIDNVPYYFIQAPSNCYFTFKMEI